MVSKCANPGCPRRLHSLAQGKLYLLPDVTTDQAPALVERMLWLCEECCQRLVVVQARGHEARLAPRERTNVAAA